jgi:hypothetical protein
MNTDAADLCVALRRGLDPMAVDVETQMLYEKWLKLEAWQARGEALPLLIGVDPTAWSRHLAAVGGLQAEAALWAIFAADCALVSTDDPTVVPLSVRAWAQRRGVTLPLALSRLFDFVATVLSPASVADRVAAEGSVLEAQEQATLLGAALSLVTKWPTQCVDTEGYFDCRKIARLILGKAIVWFPLGPPRATEVEIVELLERWVASPAGIEPASEP